MEIPDTFSADKSLKVLIISDDDKLTDVLQFCFEGWGYIVFFEGSPQPGLDKIITLSPDVIVVDVHSGEKPHLEICESLKKDFATSFIPVIALINKRQLRQELLGLRQGVDDYLLKPPDPLDLKIRIEMAVKRSQHSFYASPLTGLPGSIVIEEILKSRFDSGEPFIAGQVDIDNFKSFNDKYGYLKGDRVIMQTAYMLNVSVRTWGNKDDFVGHIGGDDFVLITTPDKYNTICKNFICMFDTVIPFHYSEKDRERGHIMAKTRTEKWRRIPIMSVTIALVMKNSPDEVRTLIELNDRMVEVKQYLKKIPGSKYMADRRIVHKDEHLSVQLFKNDESLKETYKPLGQILIEKNAISQDQLDKALKVHWKSGSRLGEILKELGMVNDEQITEALALQESTIV